MTAAAQAREEANILINAQKLKNCPGPHNFSIPRRFDTGEPQDPKEVTDKRKAIWECSVCGGRVCGNAKGWYESGFQAALKMFASAKPAKPKRKQALQAA